MEVIRITWENTALGMKEIGRLIIHSKIFSLFLPVKNMEISLKGKKRVVHYLAFFLGKEKNFKEYQDIIRCGESFYDIIDLQIWPHKNIKLFYKLYLYENDWWRIK